MRGVPMKSVIPKVNLDQMLIINRARSVDLSVHDAISNIPRTVLLLRMIDVFRRMPDFSQAQNRFCVENLHENHSIYDTDKKDVEDDKLFNCFDQFYFGMYGGKTSKGHNSVRFSR